MSVLAGVSAVLALAAPPPWPGAEPVPDPVPLAGSVHIGAVTRDPDGGAPWAVRSWRMARQSGSGYKHPGCLQVGRRAGDGLVRGARVLGFGDRAACGAYDEHELDGTPIVIERLVADPAAAAPKLWRTVAAGLVERDVRRVELTVRGRARRLRVDRVDGSWLAVLDGHVKRSDLVIRYRFAHGRPRTYDLVHGTGQGYSHDHVVPGTVHRRLTIPDPAGGLPFALVTWREVSQNGRQLCVQAGRVVDGEVGDYEPAWGSFLDAPTALDQTELSGAFLPAGIGPVHTDGCGDSGEAYGILGLSALRLQRPAPGVVVATGMLGHAAKSVAFAVAGRPARVARAGNGAFIAAFASTGAPDETVELTVRRASGKRRSGPIPLGVTSERVPWGSYEVLDGGRTLRLRWTGGTEPPTAVEGAVAADRVSVAVRERRDPAFADDGIGIGYDDVGISRCVDVALPEPLGARPVIDLTSGKPGTAFTPGANGPPQPSDCPAFALRVSAGA